MATFYFSYVTHSSSSPHGVGAGSRCVSISLPSVPVVTVPKILHTLSSARTLPLSYLPGHCCTFCF